MGYWQSVRSRWLDIGQVLFYVFVGLDSVSVHKLPKKNEANIQPSWPNKGFRGNFSCRPQRSSPEQAANHSIGFWANHLINQLRSPLLGACNSHNKSVNGIFTDQSIFRYFSREIGQFQPTWARFGEDKTMRPHVRCRHVNISPCLWLIGHWASCGDLNAR